MERVQVLIDKLKQQADQNTDPALMLLTLQSLQAELQLLRQQKSRSLNSSKVAVVFPQAAKAAPAQTPAAPAPKTEDKVLFVLEEEEADTEPVLSFTPPPKPAAPEYSYDPLLEIPTLSHQRSSRDINEALAEQQASLNDRLKETKRELGESLMDSPVEDLRKAIGINDRFTFISELFRGDETMYERSLKTLNNFNSFSDAESWISRELEIKLGWDAGSETVQEFYQVVSRRFLGRKS